MLKIILLVALATQVGGTKTATVYVIPKPQTMCDAFAMAGARETTLRRLTWRQSTQGTYSCSAEAAYDDSSESYLTARLSGKTSFPDLFDAGIGYSTGTRPVTAREGLRRVVAYLFQESLRRPSPQLDECLRNMCEGVFETELGKATTKHRHEALPGTSTYGVVIEVVRTPWPRAFRQ